ncbi:MAG: L,D-transpeptidase family protein [Steroidobacteraceae bacterium]|nr:L,D-transpeptidase family protein [Steroidobacteraceae bacterium]
MTHRSVFAVVATLAMTLLASVAAFAQQPTPSVTVPPVAAVTNPLAEAIRDRIDHLRYEKQQDARGAHIIVPELVAKYFEAQHFQPAWQDSARLDELVASIEDLRNDGLDPNDYHLEALKSYRLDVRMDSPLTLQDRADLELLATDAFMLGLYHVFVGKVDPVKLSSQWNFSQRPIPSFEEAMQRFSARLAAGEIRQAFDSARPSHAWYQRGRDRLQEYRAIAAAGGWPSIPDGPTLKPGMRDTRTPVLRKRLEVTRDLAPTPGTTAAADPDLYDATLEQAVKTFQERHGLTPDGAIGPGTRAAMNVSVAQRIDQIRVNLERGRWTLHEMKGEFVLVDVAGFYVSYFRNDEPIWTSKVVVGRDERETPIFRSTITYVVFNPTWTIPPGILVKDKLPDLRRNPGALKRMNIRVLDRSGREVNPYSVNWNQYGPSRLPPYQFVQDPGPNNALGLVKIMFPNPYLVYLHDSPAKSLYEQDQRTFSSGCIRVQQPFELTELVLNDPQWNRQKIDAVIATKETRTVNLKTPIPVLLLYWTAQPRPDGQVNFRNDVYGRDPPTLAALDSDFRLPVVN